MDLRQLRYFLVVADELSFTRAARRLNISQPPLSQQIQQLEALLETRLFTRTSRRVELTAAGQELQTQARAILAQTEQARQQIRFIGAGRTGKIDIGATGAILRGGLAGLLAGYHRLMPNVRTTIHEQAPALQLKAVLEYRTDLSFNRSVPPQEELESALAWREDVSVILPKGHRLARLRHVPLAELREDEHVMLHPDSSDFARYLQQCCIDAGFLPRISQQVVDSQSIPSPDRLRLRRLPRPGLHGTLHQQRRGVPTAEAGADRRCLHDLPARGDLARGAEIRRMGAGADGGVAPDKKLSPPPKEFASRCVSCVMAPLGKV